ncbi:TlpA family protein disulfide reductase [Bacillus sp. DNRA2]|uniref:TlpA family protein disulfide reductase n=1 Tax=Bacillus sp. DNRA2 TaxID=2723053 RepID=UPI00145FCBCC|nr:TlpA disulfide reductase family protein [Bacillus sp. DNRA2]NMD72162.1 TlpA family protein disulfide reductase [Bacillus sp. DNRA2]
MKKKIIQLTVVLVASLFIGLLLNGLNGKATNAEIGDKAPNFTLKDTSGKKVKLSDFKGEMVVLNYFTTWCAPCLEEAPELEAFGNEYQDAKLLILAKGETSNRVNKYIDGNGSKLTYLLDTKEEAAKSYNVVGQPETIIIDEKGIIVERFSGPTTKKKLIELIKKLQ